MNALLYKSIIIIGLIISAMPAGCYATAPNNNFSELTVNDNDFVGLPGYAYIKSKNPNMKIITLLAIYKSIDKQIGSDSLKSQIWINYVSNNSSKIYNNMDAKEIYEHNGFYHAFLDSVDSTITNLSTMSKDDLLRLVFTGKGEAEALNVLDTASIPKLNYVLNQSVGVFHPDKYNDDLISSSNKINKEIDEFYESVNRESARYDAGLFEDGDFNKLVEDAKKWENGTDYSTIINSMSIITTCMNKTMEAQSNAQNVGLGLIFAGMTGVITAAHMVRGGLIHGQLSNQVNQLSNQYQTAQTLHNDLYGNTQTAFNTYMALPQNAPDEVRRETLNTYTAAARLSDNAINEQTRLGDELSSTRQRLEQNECANPPCFSSNNGKMAAVVIMTLALIILVIGALMLNNSIKMKKNISAFCKINERLAASIE